MIEQYIKIDLHVQKLQHNAEFATYFLSKVILYEWNLSQVTKSYSDEKRKMFKNYFYGLLLKNKSNEDNMMTNEHWHCENKYLIKTARKE